MKYIITTMMTLLMLTATVACDGDQQIVEQTDVKTAQGDISGTETISDVTGAEIAADLIEESAAVETAEETIAQGRLIMVQYGQMEETFDLNDFEHVELDGFQYARLDEIIKAAQFPGEEADKLYDVEGSDGFKPTMKDLPMLTWEQVSFGSINIASGMLRWELDSGLPKTWNVKDTVKILVMDK